VVTTLDNLRDLIARSDWGEIDPDAFLKALGRLIVSELGCSRAGARFLVDTSAGRALRTVTMYDAAAAAVVEVSEMLDDGIDAYLITMARQGAIAASHVETDTRVPLGMRQVLVGQGARSLLETVISLNGMIYGTLCCEHVDSAAAWSPRQVDLLRRIAVRAGGTLVRTVYEDLTTPGTLGDPGTRESLSPVPFGGA